MMAPRCKPCEHCRKNHLKCDNSKPKCTRCQKVHRECVRSESNFKFRNTSSAHIQTEASEPVVKYIDETPKYTGPQRETTSTQHESREGEVESIENAYSEQSFTRISPWQGNVQKQSEPIYLPLPQRENLTLPYQTNLGEAFLLRYFVEVLARWFDICDPEKHFGTVVPQHARSCPPLFNAVLSAAARHFTTLPPDRQKEKRIQLGLQEDLIISEEAVLDYHNRCIAHLRLLASEPDAIMDENLLAAAVVFRFYEELDAPFIDLPTDAATRGLQVFIEAQANLALTSSGLRYAAFWVGFRQEFHMAFSQQRSFRISLDVCESHLTWDPAPDHVLTNRLLIIAANVLQYCYNDQEHLNHGRYEELYTLYQRWLDRRPPSFLPVYSADSIPERGEFFPQKWYLSDYYIVAEQTIGLISILLTAYDPTIARVGPGQRAAMESVDTKLKAIVLDICGIALSNRQEPTALLTASIAIAICGDRFTERREQEALMDIVLNTVRDNNYWASTTLSETLQKAWGWKS